jgi:hypothetical protein
LSRASETRQVTKDLNKKLRLEAIFRPEVRSLFARMLRDFIVSVSTTGSAPQAAIYLPDWSSALKKQYERSQRAFIGTVKETQKALLTNWYIKQTEEDEETERLEAELLLALQMWKNQHAQNSSRLIVQTNQNNMADSLREAREILQEDGEPLDNRTVAVAAIPILKRKLAGRTEKIISAETQAATESTKFFEAETLSGISPSILRPAFIVSDTRKVWRTVGDKKVRNIHMQANFQARNVNEPFLVGGEQLRHPGDTSLGASANNVINCRCSAVYRL